MTTKPQDTAPTDTLAEIIERVQAELNTTEEAMRALDETEEEWPHIAVDMGDARAMIAAIRELRDERDALRKALGKPLSWTTNEWARGL